jgi:hypothetical protein
MLNVFIIMNTLSKLSPRVKTYLFGVSSLLYRDC